MPTTFGEARTAILQTLQDTLEAMSDPPAPTMFFDGVSVEGEKDPAAAWARVLVRHVAGGQTALSDQAGVKKFTFTGAVMVQLFTPLNVAGGLGDGEELAEAIKAAFQGKHDTTDGAVWFRNAVIREVGTETPWYQWNISAEFVWDQYA